MHLELKGIHKSYGGKTAVDGVDLDIGVGDFVCILGPSGCGKTTLLRILAGLIEPDSGEINYRYVFDVLDRLGYEGWVGCEYRPVDTTVSGLGWRERLLRR